MSKGILLLADDSVTIQKVVNLTFADEGVEVITAGNGDLAMEMIATQRPNVILADVNMPGLNGYQICEKLRQSEETKDIPVLLLVGSFEPFDEAEAARVGARGFLTKPFQSIRHLITQVAELLEASNRISEEQSQSVEPSDGQPWTLPEQEAPQTSDIEELYNQSFAETVEIPAGNSSEHQDDVESSVKEFADAGMDDEIIETTYVETVTQQQPSSISPFEERVSNETGNENVEVAKTEQSFDETQEMPDYAPDPVQQQAADHGNRDRASTAWIAEGREQVDEEKSFALDGGNLLELPAGGSVRREVSPARAYITDSGTSSQQITSLSPELIDRIVEKVIERMSEMRRQN